MGQSGSATSRSNSRCSDSCAACSDWGEKDINTVKINLEHLPALLGVQSSSEDTDKKDVLHDHPIKFSSVICGPEFQSADRCMEKCMAAENTDKENAPPSTEGIMAVDKLNFNEAINKAREKLTKQQEQAAAARLAEARSIEMQENEIRQRVREELQRLKEEQDRQQENERHANQLKFDQEKQMVAEYRKQQTEAQRLEEQNLNRLNEEALRKEEEYSEKREQVLSFVFNTMNFKI